MSNDIIVPVHLVFRYKLFDLSFFTLYSSEKIHLNYKLLIPKLIIFLFVHSNIEMVRDFGTKI